MKHMKHMNQFVLISSGSICDTTCTMAPVGWPGVLRLPAIGGLSGSSAAGGCNPRGARMCLSEIMHTSRARIKINRVVSLKGLWRVAHGRLAHLSQLEKKAVKRALCVLKNHIAPTTFPVHRQSSSIVKALVDSVQKHISKPLLSYQATHHYASMATEHSSTNDSFPQSDSLYALKRHHRRQIKNELWINCLDPNLEGGVDGRYSSRAGIKTKPPMSRASATSRRSSNATRRSSMTSIDTKYKRLIEGAPVKQIPSPTVSRSEASESSVKVCPTPLDVHSGGILQDPFGPEAVSLPGPSAAKVERPPSPRAQISAFRSKHPGLLVSSYAAPMERYLAQEDDSTDFSDDPLRVEEDWKKMRSLRTEGLRLRAQRKTRRKELHEKQRAKDSADEAFMKYLRQDNFGPSMSSPSHSPKYADSILDSLFKALQKARDEYGPAEYSYNLLEDKLAEIEFELAMVEGRLYKTRLQNGFENPDVEFKPPSDDEPPSSAPVSLWGLSSEGAFENYPPVKAEYLSRLGDLDLARERYENLLGEHEVLVLEQETKERLEIKLPEDEIEFLEEYPATVAALEEEIVEIQEDVERLREKCIAEGLDMSDGSNGSVQRSIEGEETPEVGQADIEMFDEETNSPPVDREGFESEGDIPPLLAAESDQQEVISTPLNGTAIPHERIPLQKPIAAGIQDKEVNSIPMDSKVGLNDGNSLPLPDGASGDNGLSGTPANGGVISHEMKPLQDLVAKIGLDEELNGTPINGKVISEKDTHFWLPIAKSSLDKFPIIFPKSEVGKADLELFNTEFNENDKSDRIRRWMLYKLRTSALEVDLLVRVFLQVKRILDIHQWQTDMSEWEFRVLFYWERDEANKLAGSHKEPWSFQSTPEITPTKSPTRRSRHGVKYIETPKTLVEEESSTEGHQRSKSAPGSIDLWQRLKPSEILKRLRT